MNINYVDIGLLIFILGFGLIGFIVGFTEKVFTFISWTAASLLTFYTYDLAYPWVHQWIEKQAIASVVTGASLFILYLSIFSLFSKALHERIQKSMFKKADRYLGVLLGLGTGYVVLVFAALIGRTIIPDNQYPLWLKDSIIWNNVEKGTNFVESFLPLRKPTTSFLPTVPSSPFPSLKPSSKMNALKKNAPPKSSYSAQDRKDMNELMKEYA